MARADRETWAKRIEEWKGSSLSAAEYAARIGASPKVLAWWKWAFDREAKTGVPVMPRRRSSKAVPTSMTFVEMPTLPPPVDVLEVVFPSGIRVRVPEHVDVATLERVVGVLEKRR